MSARLPAHKHVLALATAPREPDDPNHRDLMSCASPRCIYTEIVCADCVREGRATSVPGAHTHAPDGTIARALSFLPKVTPIRPPGYVGPAGSKTRR
jgi:hypothetical protein